MENAERCRQQQSLFARSDAHSRLQPVGFVRLARIVLKLGDYPRWSPYRGPVIEKAITFHQNDVFSENTYTGPWEYMAHDQSRVLTFQEWRRAPYRQDRGNTYN